MVSIQIHAGDYPTGKATMMLGVIVFQGSKTLVLKGQVDEVTLATEEQVKRAGGTIGSGIAGAALLGPAGMLAGLLLGGKGKEITFILKLKDGSKMLATTDSKTFTKLQALAF